MKVDGLYHDTAITIDIDANLEHRWAELERRFAAARHAGAYTDN